jgi:foldase protein PrsA
MKKVLIFLPIAIASGVILFNIKHWFIAALVNKRPITRFSLIQGLERQGGRQVLDDLISQNLIFQEAEKQGVKINPEEMEERLKELEEQAEALGGDLDTFLGMQGQTRKGLEEQIRIRLIINKILGKEIEVSEEEIQQYFEENKEFFPEGANLEEMREDLEESLKEEKINEKLQGWLEELRAKAKIDYFIFSP